MATGSRRRQSVAKGGVAKSRASTPDAFPHIEQLIEDGGQITIGQLHPIDCAAAANDEHNSLAMLRRRPGETFTQLLARLDLAVGLAYVEDVFTDEINEPAPSSRRR
jgi:hypothetical protein